MKTNHVEKLAVSLELFEKAKQLMPGGVNSPVRAFRQVGGNPVFIKKGSGSKICDEDGNQYIDYICSWGPLLFGHNPNFIRKAIEESLQYGTSFGANTSLEITMAELLSQLVPSIEMVRMVNSGTEATMSAIRLARGFTGKDKIIKFEGCYHGHNDSFLIKAGSGALTFGVPTSPGITKKTASDTLIAKFNNIDSVKELLSTNRNEIAGIIIEPIAGNMGVIASEKQFLTDLRNLCSEEKILLIFDEVMTGFRVAAGGAQELYGIEPDITTLGKIIGGGLPVGAYGGKSNIMEMIAPSGPIYQAGTLSGNPIAMSAGIAALNYIKNNPSIYDQLEEKASYLEQRLKKVNENIGKNWTINRVGSMMTLFFTEERVVDYDSAIKSDTEKFSQYFQAMLKQGIMLPPSQFEALFISTEHTIEDLDYTIEAYNESIQNLK